jgi:hypothetical protein
MKLVKPAPSWTAVQIAAIASAAHSGPNAGAAATSSWWERVRHAFAPAVNRPVSDSLLDYALPAADASARTGGRLYHFPRRGDRSAT